MSLLKTIQSTERHILSVAATPIDRGDYSVSRSERYTDWYQVNMIELRRPNGRSLADWERIYRTHFDPEVYPHTTLYIPDSCGFETLIREIESVCADEASDATPSPLYMERITYMFADGISRCPPMPPELEVRPVESEADWESLIEFSIAEAREEPWFTSEQTMRSYIETRREISQRVGITWLRLVGRGNAETIARLGIFDHQGVSRLQSVGTAAAHRRRGMASALVGHAIRLALESRGTRGLALAVETDTGAHTLYSSLGFKPVGTELWMMRYPAPSDSAEHS